MVYLLQNAFRQALLKNQMPNLQRHTHPQPRSPRPTPPTQVEALPILRPQGSDHHRGNP